jgi:hypothetical protein
MPYATKANVALLSGIDVGDINDIFLTLADSAVHRICNRVSFETVVEDCEEYFDIERRNVFYENDVGSRNYPLSNWPVTSVSAVELIYRSTEANNVVTATTTSLTLDSGYFLDNLERGCIVKISSETDMPIGKKVLKVTYNYGYSSVPQDIKDFCDYYAAALVQGNLSVPVSSTGAPLVEVEIGRYRERYANPATVYKNKYGIILEEMEKNLINRYKIWE